MKKGTIRHYAQSGFTLIEIIMTIIILGILAVVAYARLFNLTDDAKIAAEQGVVGGVRTGLYAYYSHDKAHPVTLDSASNGSCTKTNPCFTAILGQGGVTGEWVKAGQVYVGPTGAAYTYNPADGSFQP